MVDGEAFRAAQDGPWRVAATVWRGADHPDERLRVVARALRDGSDLLLQAPGVVIDAEAMAELRRCAASDPMIAIVSPRFDPLVVSAVLARHLPAVGYVPLPDPRCLYVKTAVLATLKPSFDDTGWDGYAAEINRYGFRCAIANHAGAEIRGGDGPGSDGAALDARAARLGPEAGRFATTVRGFLADTPREADRLVAALAPTFAGRLRVAFDCSHIGPHHSGTAELARQLIGAMTEECADRFDMTVVASEAAFAAHFGGMPRLRRLAPERPETFGVLVRIGQPFGWKEVDHAVHRAPVLVVFLLDTIGLDCLRLASDDLDGLWRFVVAQADGLLFNSAFTQAQFARRFGLPAGRPALASLHALDLTPLSEAGSGPGTVLVIGNSFAHKRVAETARLLVARCPGLPVVALGPDAGRVPGVETMPSGALDAGTLATLYRRARIVVYPTLYEGFGFPVIEALRHRRPVVLRRLPPFVEIAEALGDARNLHWFDTEDELVRLVTTDLAWIAPAVETATRPWSECAHDLARVVAEAVEGVSHARVLARLDFMRGRVDWARMRRFEGELDDEIGRVAAFAGRLSQRAVLAAASLAPGRALLRLVARRRAGRP